MSPACYPAMVYLQTMKREDRDFDIAAGLPVSAPDQFCFQRLEEAFDGRVVVTISFAAHRYLEPLLSQKRLVIVSAVLRPAICMVDAARWRPAQGDGHVQRPEGQILLHSVADGPANDAP